MASAAPRFLLGLVLGLVLNRSSASGQTPTPSLLGQWHGTSICVKAAWNAACNDEEVFLWFEPAPTGLPRILLHAYKRVGSGIESMGDLEALPDTGQARWAADFSNTRVHIRWLYQVTDSGLTGTLVQLPSMRVARHQRAQRDSTWRPPPD